MHKEWIRLEANWQTKAFSRILAHASVLFNHSLTKGSLSLEYDPYTNFNL